jgi:ABC-type dipeptide/oligopeptide/nickel transport system permease subunit
MVAGYLGGSLDTIIMRVMDWLLAFPLFLLALVVIATLGAGSLNVIFAIGISCIPRFARVVRGQTLQLRNELYVDAARVNGCRVHRILLRHILPNASSVIIVMFTLYLATAVLVEASLSFLGLGTPPPTPSWGLMVSSSRGVLLTAPWAVLFPGLAITFTVLGLNLLGDGLRDALDPTLS